MLLVVIIFMILISGVSENSDFTLLDYFSGQYSAYTSVDSGEESVDLGFCYINSAPVKENVVGESMVINNLEVGSALSALNARVVKTEYLDTGATVIYAYTNLISQDVNIDNEKVNLQIAHYGDYSVIGWPLILGSF